MIADCGLRIADSRAMAPSQSAIHNPQSAITWHLLLDATGRPGHWNMALDEALLDQADRTGAALLRLYRWDPPCLSFGRNEPALPRYDRAAIERLGLDVVRRPTGGRAVWHEHEVTYAVAAPVARCGSLRESYRAIHARLAAALRRLGADAVLAADGRAPGLASGACFAAPVGGEVLVGARKVIGSAQVRRGRAFLQHGSILLDGSQDVVRDVSRERGPGSSETSLTAVLGRPVSFGDVATAIIASWGAELTASAPAGLRPDPSARFSDPAWTWRR
jgi:lipoate-protein ligase A